MAQVKFYSVGADAEMLDLNGIYFVEGGSIYKGTTRFGANKVYTANANAADIEEAANGLTDLIAGDILLGFGGAKVWDGAAWQDLTADVEALQSSWQSDISASIDSLVSSFTTGDADGQVKLGSVNATVSGWSTITGSVSDLESRVSAIEGIVDASNSTVTASTVTASTGVFTNLTVADTATFSATTVSASSLTVNGSTVEEIADARISAIPQVTKSSSATGITVSVTTSGGSVTAVSVDATSFGNVMHFVGVKASTGAVSNPEDGDIVVIGSQPASGFVAGQEYIYNDSAWELIGDQNSYALNAYASEATVLAGATTLPGAVDALGAAVDAINESIATLASAVTGGSASSTLNGVTVEVVTAATTAAPTVTLSGVGTAASVDFATTVTSNGTALPTQSAVYSAIQDALVWLDAGGTPIV